MLAIPSHLLVLQMLGKGFQEDLPKHGGEVDQSAILQILLTLLEDRSDFCSIPVLGNLPQSP